MHPHAEHTNTCSHVHPKKLTEITEANTTLSRNWPITVDKAAATRYPQYLSPCFFSILLSKNPWDNPLAIRPTAAAKALPKITYQTFPMTALTALLISALTEPSVKKAEDHVPGITATIANKQLMNNDNILKENMIITVEPGIYIPGEFGVRIEDDVLVSKNSEVLTSKLEKQLDFTL